MAVFSFYEVGLSYIGIVHLRRTSYCIFHKLIRLTTNIDIKSYK